MRVPKRDGFSLIEILVVSGVASVLALIIGQMMISQFRATRALELRSAARDLVEDMVGILNNRDNCVASLGGMNPNNATATRILVDSSPSDIVRYTTASPGNEIGPLKIKLTQIQLNTDSTKGVPSIGNLATGTALLTLSFSLGSSVVGGATFEAERRISVVTDASGRISSCSTTLMDKQMAQYFCSTLGGSWSAGGRGGLGDCQNLVLNGALKVGGTLEVTGKTTLKDDVTVDNATLDLKGPGSGINLNP